MQLKVYIDNKVIYPAMPSGKSGCLLYLFTNLTSKFLLGRLAKFLLLRIRINLIEIWCIVINDIKNNMVRKRS